MQRLFWNLSIANLLLLTIVVAWGHFIDPADTVALGRFDVLASLAGLFTLLVHSIVYTYFIAAGKFVQAAVEEHGHPDATAIDRAKRHKLKAFRYGFMAIWATFLALVLHFWLRPGGGGIAANDGGHEPWVTTAAYLALLMNACAAHVEGKYVAANGVLTDKVLAEVSARRAGAATRPTAGTGTNAG